MGSVKAIRITKSGDAVRMTRAQTRNPKVFAKMNSKQKHDRHFRGLMKIEAFINRAFIKKVRVNPLSAAIRRANIKK